jgi:hypothetical protein
VGSVVADSMATDMDERDTTDSVDTAALAHSDQTTSIIGQ